MNSPDAVATAYEERAERTLGQATGSRPDFAQLGLVKAQVEALLAISARLADIAARLEQR